MKILFLMELDLTPHTIHSARCVEYIRALAAVFFPAAALLIFRSCQKFVLNLSFLEREECQFPFTSQATRGAWILSLSLSPLQLCSAAAPQSQSAAARKGARGGPSVRIKLFILPLVLCLLLQINKYSSNKYWPAKLCGSAGPETRSQVRRRRISLSLCWHQGGGACRLPLMIFDSSLSAHTE